MELNLVGCLDNSDGTLEVNNRVYNPNGVSPTVTTQQGGAEGEVY